MKFRKYRRYFVFVFTNWGIVNAIFTTYHEIRGEKKYHINTTGFDDLKKLTIDSSHKENAYIYQPVNYFIIEKAFDYLLSLSPTEALVDFGCGKGRIMAVAAHYGFKKITGVDFAEELCRNAQTNIDSIQNLYPDTQFNILNIDAINYKIQEDDNVFTFFNPFDNGVMLPLVKSILESLKTKPRRILVVYFNPTEKEIFLSAGFNELWHYKKLGVFDFSVLEFEPEENLN